MNLNRAEWSELDYQDFVNYLDSISDKKYKDFQKRFVLDSKDIKGIKIPILKEISKEISKGNYQEFLNLIQINSYEEANIYGLVISYLKIHVEDILRYLDDFIIHIDNWATNDIVACNLKIIKKNQEVGLEKIKEYLKSDNPWIIRFGLVLLLAHYINDDYIDKALVLANEVTNDHYYVKMANAWLISICYIKYRDKTNEFLLNTKIDDWTYNKSISKIRDSYRVSKEDKDFLLTIKK